MSEKFYTRNSEVVNTHHVSAEPTKNPNTNHKDEEPVSTSADQKYMEVETKEAIIDAINLVKVKKYVGDKAPVVGYVHKGDRVLILKSEGNYYKIRFGVDRSRGIDKIGYIASEFCKEV